MTFICILTDDVLHESCPNCGGWRRADNGHFDERTHKWVKDPGRGPFVALDGNDQYCSEDCYEEAQTFAERARRARESDWCPECGFDRHEHNEGCSRA